MQRRFIDGPELAKLFYVTRDGLTRPVQYSPMFQPVRLFRRRANFNEFSTTAARIDRDLS